MTQTIIETIPILPFGMVNAFLVIHERRALLVDTGLPGSEGKIENALKMHKLDWSDIALTVLTHAHIDHAGSAAQVRRLTAQPLFAHKDEFPYCNGYPPVLRPSGIFGRVFQKTGAIEQGFEYFTPDLPLTKAEADLSPFGFPASALHTPGHTPGSLSVLLDDGRVIAGDLLASGILLGGIAMRSRPKKPPFEEDTVAVADSLDQLLSRGGKYFYLGHGGRLPASTVRAHVSRLRSADRPGVFKLPRILPNDQTWM
ncbi:MBL fold metallo-hydrolase [Lutimaribacter saemankumensis]|uniref:Glyoxylase, beta-lactamase superfamily II n=1 Tax=Lutimaribacter saemankumensis TaxID=490829 RepID=A0A1G8K9X0_9RHOB|nr:MBL fold metallo-hydrolase [Lutimaribacter saemankumensis]SDI40276.1 Glyoxylase, beta-lactamase superfamily II [Lutimaribacter saemankumensis]